MEIQGLTPLMICCVNGYTRIAELLLRHGADSSAVGMLQANALMIAAGTDADIETCMHKYVCVYIYICILIYYI